MTQRRNRMNKRKNRRAPKPTMGDERRAECFQIGDAQTPEEVLQRFASDIANDIAEQEGHQHREVPSND